VYASWNFRSYILTEQTWQACNFPIYGAALHRVVYQDAEECGEARLAKTLSNLGILKIKLTFYFWGLSNFNIHRMLQKDQGSLSTT
jgi:hypothetical protein